MSFSEWREVKVSEIGKIVTGKTPKTAISENYGGNIPFLTPSDDMNIKKVKSTARTLSEMGLNSVKNCLLPAKSICVSCIGSVLGKVVLTSEPTVTNQQINSIVPDEKFDPDFIYYGMTILGKHLNYLSKTSTAVPIINKTTFSNFSIIVPTIEEQKAIAHILSTLDDKIEVNNQINKTLENMAQAIFKQWFVDFEFPNENGEPYKSSGGEMVESELGTIPKGWEVVQFRDIFRFVKGKKPKTIAECEFKDSEKYLTIDVLNRNSVLFCSKEKVIEANSEDVLMVMDGASSGAVYFGQKGVVASTLAKLELISQKVSNQFLFYAIKYFENDIKTHTTGSAIPHTDKEYTYRLMIALPNDISLQTKIDDLLCDISDTFIAREQENAVLKATRDTLLPKLMSGEIRVPLDQDGYAS